ncbi:MAG TPA: flagellar basal body-associated FliL family protein [Candidatus Binataceae bacterium]|nr:flagellar basal body-associated FliL family protein [Candidatus Binataceae bacterium]
MPIAALALLGGGGVLVLRYQGLRSKSPSTPPPPPPVAYVDAKELTLRLADTDAEHYIKLDPVLAVPADAVDSMTDRVPVVRDRIVSVVSAHTAADLATPAGAQRLKEQIRRGLAPEFQSQVVDIYFSEYLVE